MVGQSIEVVVLVAESLGVFVKYLMEEIGSIHDITQLPTDQECTR